MMFGLEYIVASQMMLASAGSPVMTCQMKVQPQITVVAKGLDRGINHTKSIRELNAFKPSVGPSPYGAEVETYLQGVASGGVSVTGQYEFGQETHTGLRQSCLYVNKVEITITLDSTIYIASEYPKGTCHYNAVLEHEKTHVAVDRELVNKYSNIIVKAVNNTLKTVGYAQGPFPANQMPEVQKKIDAYLSQIIGAYGKNFAAERNKRQGQVDTISEYNRVHAVCENWPKPKL